jgi:hypothetical protein
MILHTHTRFGKGTASSRAASDRFENAALQFAEKLTIRIRVSLQRYRKGSRISLGFSRCALPRLSSLVLILMHFPEFL